MKKANPENVLTKHLARRVVARQHAGDDLFNALLDAEKALVKLFDVQPSSKKDSATLSRSIAKVQKALQAIDREMSTINVIVDKVAKKHLARQVVAKLSKNKIRQSKKALKARGVEFGREMKSRFGKVISTEGRPRKGGFFRFEWDVLDGKKLLHGYSAEVSVLNAETDEVEVLWTWIDHTQEPTAFVTDKMKTTLDQVTIGFLETPKMNKLVQNAAKKVNG